MTGSGNRMTAVWLSTRCVAIVWCATTALGNQTLTDLNRYGFFATGQEFPSGGDWFPWEYPVLARLLISPDFGTDVGTYVRTAIVLLVLADGCFTFWLARRSTDAGTKSGVWFWILAAPLLTAIPFTRYDLVVSVVVGVALSASVQFPRLAAGMLSAATALKLWPLAIVPLVISAAPRARRRWVALCGIAPWVAFEVLGVAVWGWRSAIAPWAWHSDRGVQIESPLATIAFWARAGDVQIEYRFNSYEVEMSPLLATAWSVLGAGVVLTVLYRSAMRLRDARDIKGDQAIVVGTAALAVISALLVSGKVLSPQYLVWLMVPLAVLGADRRIVRPAVLWITGLAAALTTAVYPISWAQLVSGEQSAWAVAALRNVLLLVIATLLLMNWHRAISRSNDQPMGRHIVKQGAR